MSTFALAIHGGCGVLAPHHLEARCVARSASRSRPGAAAGWVLLRDGGRALDAVETAVVVLEDSPHFNAGHGAALNAEGDHELDAAIMNGADLAAGAIIAARRVRNPVKAARAVLDSGNVRHAGGSAADRFAGERGLAIVDPGYFTTEQRQQTLDSMKAHERAGTTASEAEKHGTVGAVALDRHGHLAAATSTGGYTNKPAGRVGDSPIIGAGTYARDGVCAVSGTGQGEYFIRHVLGHEVASRIADVGRRQAALLHVVLRLEDDGVAALQDLERVARTGELVAGLHVVLDPPYGSHSFSQPYISARLLK